MATIYGKLSYTTRDILGVAASHDEYVSIDDTKTIANMASFLNAYLDVVDPIQAGHIESANIAIYPSIGSRTAALSSSRVEQTGLYNFSQTGSPYKYGVDIPALSNTVLVSGHIDLTDAAVTAFIAFMEAAHTGFQIVSKYRIVLVALLDAAITFRKKRRALARVSTEPGT